MRSFFAEASFDTEEGDQLNLVCDFFTIQVVEDITGQNWDEIIPQMTAPPQSLFISVLYGLLRKRHQGITIDQAAAILYDVGDRREALAAVMGAVIGKACNFEPDEDEEETEPAAPKKKPAGRSRVSEKSG